jgi:hypothetical protein
MDLLTCNFDSSEHDGINSECLLFVPNTFEYGVWYVLVYISAFGLVIFALKLFCFRFRT